MDDHLGRRAGSIITKLAAMSFISPLIAMAWVAVRLFRPGRRRRGLIALSVLGNVLFVVVVIIGYYEAINAERRGRTETGALVGPECVQCPQGPLLFCETPSQSELTRIVPNAIYVAFDGLLRARFEFTDQSMSALKEVTLSDKCGRPWIDADLENGTLVFSRYSDDKQTDPDVTLLDRDGDGVPDRMVDWIRGQGFVRRADITWHSLEDEK